MPYIKHLLFLFLLFTAANLTAQNVTIRANVKDLPAGEVNATLSMVNGNNVNVADSRTPNKKGSVTFEVAVDKPTMYLLGFSNLSQNVIHLMLMPGDNISLELRYDASCGFLCLESAKGSKDVELYQQFNQQLYNFTKQAKKIDDEYRTPGTNQTRQRELSSEFMQLQTSHNVAVRQLLEKNTDVLISAFLVTYFDNDVETYIDLFEAIEKGLKENYADNQFVQYVSSKVKTSLGPGRMAPEIAMKDPEGNERKLSDLRGKVVMIDFWASWCRPCRMENPNVVKLYKKYHSKGFDIFSVSLDKSRADWTRAIAQDGLEWENHVSDLNGWTSSGGAAYGITSVPSTVLVDRQGRIIARNLRGEQLELKLKEIFGE